MGPTYIPAAIAGYPSCFFKSNAVFDTVESTPGMVGLITVQGPANIRLFRVAKHLAAMHPSFAIISTSPLESDENADAVRIHIHETMQNAIASDVPAIVLFDNRNPLVPDLLYGYLGTSIPRGGRYAHRIIVIQTVHVGKTTPLLLQPHDTEIRVVFNDNESIETAILYDGMRHAGLTMEEINKLLSSDVGYLLEAMPDDRLQFVVKCAKAVAAEWPPGTPLACAVTYVLTDKWA